MRGVLLVGSIGLALHLVLPQIPGLERSLRLGEEIRAARQQLATRPAEVPKLAALALGYWRFDALCLIMFTALGVAADPLVLHVAYGWLPPSWRYRSRRGA